MQEEVPLENISQAEIQEWMRHVEDTLETEKTSNTIGEEIRSEGSKRSEKSHKSTIS